MESCKLVIKLGHAKQQINLLPPNIKQFCFVMMQFVLLENSSKINQTNEIYIKRRWKLWKISFFVSIGLSLLSSLVAGNARRKKIKSQRCKTVSCLGTSWTECSRPHLSSFLLKADHYYYLANIALCWLVWTFFFHSIK